MRLHVAICDDEMAEIDYLTGLTRGWAEAGNINVKISTYDSAEAFLFAFDADKSLDILLLDIQMKGLDGITLAKKLRADGGDMQIIFITAYPDFIAEGYDVSALHYLMKPVSCDKFSSVMDRALRLLDKADRYILVDTEAGQTRIFLREIYYAEAYAHMSTLFTETGSIEARCSIGKLETLLGDDFCRIHRSCLVGLRHIRQITKADVIMDNGKALPLARRRYDDVNRAFIRFYSEQGR